MASMECCDFCPRPAVCFGADLVNPKYRCPRHCHEHHTIEQHGDPDYLRGHESAEGVTA